MLLDTIAAVVSYVVTHTGILNAPAKGVESVPWDKIKPDSWWGPMELQANPDTGVYPASIKFNDEMVADLRARLNNHRTMVAPMEGTAFEWGFNHDQIEPWVEFWANKYDFKAREANFNKYPMYKTNIQGLDIFFVRVTPNTNKTIVPMLMLHGWPGSIAEFWEAIPLITEVSADRDFAVEVIVPCQPGFGWSQGAVRPGLGAPRVAVLFRNLMRRLGFKQWYIQGGDIGSMVSTHMATMYPDEILGFHTNMPAVLTPQAIALQVMGSLNPSMIVSKEQEHRMYPLMKLMSGLMEDMGFMHLQATKPDTIGACLDSSPVAMLAYILEKFSIKTDVDGGLFENYDPNWLIDNLMVYWSTKTGTTSARFYSETMNKEIFAMGLDSIQARVLTCVAQAPHEILYQPESILRLKFPNLLHITELKAGGHFLAQGQPKEFSADVLNALLLFQEHHKKGTKAVVNPNIFAETAAKLNGAISSKVNFLLNGLGVLKAGAFGAVADVADLGVKAVSGTVGNVKSLMSKVPFFG